MIGTHDENEEQRRQVDPAEICAHMRVNYDPIDHGNERYTSRWRCADCRLEFVPGKLIDHAIRAMFPEQTTLRDQFAMVALLGLMAKTGLERDGCAHDAYLYADTMMEARK